jgi:DNA-binding NtrC family response regulator
MRTSHKPLGGLAPLSFTAPSGAFLKEKVETPTPVRSSADGDLRERGAERVRILIVDDDRALRDGCASVLRADGFDVVVLGSGGEALEIIKRSRFDIMLVDVCMTPVSGLDVLREVMATAPATLVVLMTGNPNLSSSLEALQNGAWDYLAKPYSGTQLQLLIGRAAHLVARRHEHDAAGVTGEGALAATDQMSIFGTAPGLRQALALARRVATTKASVMIVGETGTGKELLAQCIHRYSRRSDRPLVAVNCAAMPEHLLESEMFGHRKGAFTGADREKIGLLEMAHLGTLFFDELTEMPVALQAKLLRVIQDGVIRRVGSEQQDAVVDVRFISATNREPREAIRDRKLREDLFYRLNVVQVTLPPLRERTEDIPVLANHFLGLFWERHRFAHEPQPTFSEDALELITSRPWRGNVRELQNFVEHIAVLARPGSTVTIEQLPLEQHFASDVAERTPYHASMNDAYHVSKEQVLASFEKEYVTRLVARASGNMARAARLACMDRTTLYRLLERHGFRREPDSQRPIPTLADSGGAASSVAHIGSHSFLSAE